MLEDSHWTSDQLGAASDRAATKVERYTFSSLVMVRLMPIRWRRYSLAAIVDRWRRRRWRLMHVINWHLVV